MTPPQRALPPPNGSHVSRREQEGKRGGGISMGDNGQVQWRLPQAPERCLLGPPLPPAPLQGPCGSQLQHHHPPWVTALSRPKPHFCRHPSPTREARRRSRSCSARCGGRRARSAGTSVGPYAVPLSSPTGPRHSSFFCPMSPTYPLPSHRNASSKASGAPTAPRCPCRGAELAGDQQGPNREAGDRPPERDRRGTRWCRPRLGGAPADADDR